MSLVFRGVVEHGDAIHSMGSDHIRRAPTYPRETGEKGLDDFAAPQLARKARLTGQKRQYFPTNNMQGLIISRQRYSINKHFFGIINHSFLSVGLS